MSRSRLGGRALVAAGLVALVAAVGGAQESVPGADPPPLTVSEISRRAEEVIALLQRLETEARPSSEVEPIRQALPDARTTIAALLEETNRALASDPNLLELDRLASSWRSIRSDLRRWVEALSARAARLEQDLVGLGNLRKTWRQARADAQASRAPAPVIARAAAILAEIEATTRDLSAQRSAVLVLLDEVAQQTARCDEAVTAIATSREQAATQILVRDAPPVWRMEIAPRVLVEHVRKRAADNLADVRRIARQHPGRMLVLTGVLVVLVVLAYVARRRIRAWRAAGIDLPPSVGVLDRPLAAAGLVALLCAIWLYRKDGRAVTTLLTILTLGPILRLVTPVVPRTLAPWLWSFGLLVAFDRTRDLAGLAPSLDQGPLLVEFLAGAIVSAFLMVRRSQPPGEGTRADRGAGLAARVMGAVLATAFLAGALGHVSFARLLGVGTLLSAYLALSLLATGLVVHGLIGFAFREQPLGSVRLIREHRALVERQISALLRRIGFLLWASGTLWYFGVLGPVVQVARAVLTAEWRQGAIAVSLFDLLVFGITVWLAVLLARLLEFVLREEVYPRMVLAPGLSYAVTTILRYVIVFVGLLIGLAALGVDLTKVTVLAGAFGVGIAFGLQNVINNFVSGLIVLFERPIRIGDTVQIADVRGEVRRIGIRSTTVRTAEGADVIVPNATLVSERVTNWTSAPRTRRVDVAVRVAHGVDPGQLLELLTRVAQATPGVVSTPAPLALFTGFQPGVLGFEIRAWTEHADEARVRSDLGLAAYAALREAGIQLG